jgi:hypothetical protein
MRFRRRKFTTEMERIAHTLNLRHRIQSHSIALAFTWLAVFLTYAVSMRLIFITAPPGFMDWYMDEPFMLFYGLGMITATGLLPLFELLFLMDDATEYRRDKALLAEISKREKPSPQFRYL